MLSETSINIGSVSTNRVERNSLSLFFASTHALNYLVLVFVVIQIIINGMGRNGPHIDEGIYFIAGGEILKGGLDEGGYIVWFAGSPFIWPIISHLGFKFLGGLFGARLMATLFAAIALYCFGRFSRLFVGKVAGFWATALFAVFGPFMHLAHFTVYDVFSLAGTTISCWFLAEHYVNNRSKMWLVFAGVVFSLAVMGKYPIILMGGPLVILMLVLTLQTGRSLIQWLKDTLIFGIAVVIPLVLYTISFWNLGFNEWWEWGNTHRDSFGATRESLAWAFMWYALFPIVAGIITASTKKDDEIPLMLLAFGTLALWPTYHILSLNGSADQKHIIFSVLFMYPLIGTAMEKYSLSRFGQVIIFLIFGIAVTYGSIQMWRLDTSWTDTRPGGQYLASLTERGDKILIADAWSTLPHLIAVDKLADRYDVSDLWTVENIADFDPCKTVEWVVELEGSTYTYPAGYMDRVRNCGFKEVFRRKVTVTPGNILVGFYEMDWVIYHREIPQ